ncbi:hypothetical protein Anapl_11228 [Anas platyrhynchos]|uniref:Uncharacterized protein n=1 Tax=Anas platyrhynchos TaxID=8839 RepID=R0JH01_ANAPL|nr:hypothetical protein Anapl_11228 [Anas platyrhynchos]
MGIASLACSLGWCLTVLFSGDCGTAGSKEKACWTCSVLALCIAVDLAAVEGYQAVVDTSCLENQLCNLAIWDSKTHSPLTYSFYRGSGQSAGATSPATCSVSPAGKRSLLGGKVEALVENFTFSLAATVRNDAQPKHFSTSKTIKLSALSNPSGGGGDGRKSSGNKEIWRRESRTRALRVDLAARRSPGCMLWCLLNRNTVSCSPPVPVFACVLTVLAAAQRGHQPAVCLGRTVSDIAGGITAEQVIYEWRISEINDVHCSDSALKTVVLCTLIFVACHRKGSVLLPRDYISWFLRSQHPIQDQSLVLLEHDFSLATGLLSATVASLTSGD